MGWKLSMVVLDKSPRRYGFRLLLNELGYTELKKVGKVTFEEAINPKEGKLYVGTYKNKTIICESHLAYDMLNSGLSLEEVRLNEMFSNKEVCSLVLHSGNNVWGYSVSKNGKKLRVRAGSSDDGTVIDLGSPLEEEIDLLGKSILDKEGGRIFQIDGDEYPEDAVGESFVFSLFARYFNVPLDYAEDDLFELNMQEYQFVKNEILPPENRKKEKIILWIIITIGVTLLLLFGKK